MDLSGFVMTDRDTAFMAIGTAFGGLQTPLLRRILDEPTASCSRVLSSPTGMAAVVSGISFITLGASARLGKIEVGKEVSAFALGYGISCIISLLINYITSTTLSEECRTN